MPRLCLQRAGALLALDRLEEAAEMVAVGLVAARDQELPYEEALLLQVGSAVDERRGLAADAAGARRVSDALLAGLGAAGWRSPDGPRSARGPAVTTASWRRRRRRRGRAPTPGRDCRRTALAVREMTHANWVPMKSSWSVRVATWAAV